MILKNANVLTGDFKFHKTDITVKNGVFVNPMQSDSETEIDMSGKYVVPGLIDIHVHGGYGHQIGDEDISTVPEMAKYLLQNGTTTFAPTIDVRSNAEMVSLIEEIKTYIASGKLGAEVGGIHLEGPYVSMDYKGALNPRYVREPDVAEFEQLNKVAEGLIRIVSMAPEVSRAFEFIEQVSRKCTISIAHTDSDYDTASLAIEKGASHMTHTFNAMRPYKHREPNALGAAFDSNITCECISDGIHLHPATVRTLYKIVGAKRLVLISDGCRQVGMKDGEYLFGDKKLLIKDGKATLPDGTIDGGCFTLLHNVRCAIKFGIPAEDAFRCASLNPAKVLKIDDKVGSIDEGKNADFLVLDEQFQLCAVYKKGKLV